MGAAYVKVLVVALALALDVFAVSIGVGIRGVSRRQKITIGIAFACAEIVMNLLGVGLGAVAGRLIGDFAGYIGFAALFVLGLAMLRENRTDLSGSRRLDLSTGRGLLTASLAISLDSLGIGFSILYIGVPLEISLATIFIASIAATTVGLSLGRWIGRFAERNAAAVAGVLLVLTGIVFAALKALRVG